MNICSNFYPHTIIFCSNKDWGEQKSFYRKTSSQTRPHVGNTLNWRKNAVFCHYSFLPSISSSSLLCNYGFWVCYKRDFFLCGQDVFLISPSCRSEQWSISEEDTTDNESLCKTPAQCYQLLSCKSSIKIMPIFTFLFCGFGQNDTKCWFLRWNSHFPKLVTLILFTKRSTYIQPYHKQTERNLLSDTFTKE